MKKLLFLFFTIFGISASAQSVFKEIDFEQAISLSNKTGKMILVQLEAFDCEMCNFLGENAFLNPALAKRVSETFIPIKIGIKHKDRSAINYLYNLTNESFGTLFIDWDKNLIHRFLKTTGLIKEYDSEMDMALYRNSEVIKLSYYEDVYKKTKNNNDLEQWISERGKMNLNNDSLLNVYAKNLPKDSLSALRVLVFIANEAPLRASFADMVLRQNAAFNAAWFSMPLQKRININNRIIAKSMQKAILNKDENYGMSVASFAKAVHDNNDAGTKAFIFQAMKYYEGVKELKKYVNYAVPYYEDLLRVMTVDSVNKIDVKRKEEASKNATLKEHPITGDKAKLVKSFSYAPIGQNYTHLLNNAAWFIYTIDKDKIYLDKALFWAKKANEYSKNFHAMDTEARILYKLGKKEEAITVLEKAILFKTERLKSEKAFNSLNEVLLNMRANKSSIDEY